MSEESTHAERRPSLAAVAISYNEERDIRGFLDHLVPWIDEIVIIDDGSTDRTGEIAASYGPRVRFIVSPRKEGEYFSHQRNKGIAAARSDWLLHMDIDERVPPELAAEIRRAIARDAGMQAYRFRRLNFFLHRPMRGGGWQSWNLVHLAQREVLQFEGMFHEKCRVAAPESAVGQLENRMWHLNDDSFAERMEKSDRYLTERIEELRERQGKIRWWHLLGYPAREFVSKYLFKAGYRDGTVGLLFAIHAAVSSFRACALIWDADNARPRASVERQVTELWKAAPEHNGR